MPEDVVSAASAVTAFMKAKAAVAAWLAGLGGHAEMIAAEDLGARYPLRGMAFGWRLSVKFSDQVRRLDLLLPIGFPWQPPRVTLVDRPPFLTWPHVEKDGLLCLAPNTFEIDPDEPVRAVAFVLGEAEEAVNNLIAGNCDGDFQDEFASYWDWASDPGPRVISLVRPEPPPRAVRLWRGKRFYLLGETDDDLRHWLANASGKLPDDFHPVPAAFFWLEKPPVPSQYPRTASSLRALLGNAGKDATRLVQQLVRDRPDRIFAALGVQTGNGSVIASVIVSEPVAPQHGVRDPLAKGFRPHAVPDAILLARYFGGGAIMRRPVERADAAWVHGRGQDPDAQRLRSMTVVIIGCGSMGGPVAITLAQAGVGRIILIDFDTLSWANVGRHPLGAACVNSSKAKGLAEKLRADFPHTTFEYHDIDMDTAVRQLAELLASSNLIVATTGSWAADGRLDAWHAAAGRAVPIVYGWMEPHACAGHALLLAGTEACLRCGFDGTGLPDFRVTTWPAGTTRQEPACGAVFQPYGPVELGYVNSLVSELALDTLLNGGTTPLHRLWVGDGIRLRQLGGGWTSDWQVDPQFRDGGGFIAERAWPRARCLRCAKARAA